MIRGRIAGIRRGEDSEPGPSTRRLRNRKQTRERKWDRIPEQVERAHGLIGFHHTKNVTESEKKMGRRELTSRKRDLSDGFKKKGETNACCRFELATTDENHWILDAARNRQSIIIHQKPCHSQIQNHAMPALLERRDFDQP
jgi:hypothetical protein